MVSRPVWTDEVRNYTVCVPYTENREFTRMVCRNVPVTETRTVCEDQGRWEEQQPSACGPATPPACGPCAPAAPTQKVWVPNVVQRQVEVTCLRPQMVPEKYTCPVTLTRQESRQCTVRVCHYEQTPVTREVCTTVCVPQTRTWVENVTTCRVVPVQQTRQCTVMVPHQVAKTINVQVCRMVPKQVKVPVCAPAPCCDTAPCCQPACRRCCHRRGC
jgi:hypothetical protein